MILPPKSVVMRIFYAKTIWLTLEKNVLYMSKLYNMSFIDFEVAYCKVFNDLQLIEFKDY